MISPTFQDRYNKFYYPGRINYKDYYTFTIFSRDKLTQFAENLTYQHLINELRIRDVEEEIFTYLKEEVSCSNDEHYITTEKYYILGKFDAQKQHLDMMEFFKKVKLLLSEFIEALKKGYQNNTITLEALLGTQNIVNFNVSLFLELENKFLRGIHTDDN